MLTICLLCDCCFNSVVWLVCFVVFGVFVRLEFEDSLFTYGVAWVVVCCLYVLVVVFVGCLCACALVFSWCFIGVFVFVFGLVVLRFVLIVCFRFYFVFVAAFAVVCLT